MGADTSGLLDFIAGLAGAEEGPRPGSIKATKFSQLGWDTRRFQTDIARSFHIEDKTTNAMLRLGPLLANNRPQMELLFNLVSAMERGGPIRLLILKSRKLGVSTILEILLLAIAIYVRGITCAIIAHTDDSSLKLMKIIRDCYEHLPKEMRAGLPTRYYNTSLLQFGNKEFEKVRAAELGHVATVKCETAGGQYPLTGDTVRVLHLSECAKYDAVGDYAAQQRFILSALGAVPKAGPSMVLAESTANGQQGWFYDQWQKSRDFSPKGAEGEWQRIFFSWLEDPACRAPVPDGYDWGRWFQEDMKTEEELKDTFRASKEQLFFRRSIIKVEMAENWEVFDQEYPTTPSGAFLASGRPAVARRIIKGMEASIRNDYDRYMVKVVESHQSEITYAVDDGEQA